MYARVAKWEGGTADAIRRAVEEIGSRTGPPPGVPAKGFLMLIDPDGGKSMAVGLFDTEEDMRQGHEALNNMNPQTGADAGRRTSVEFYEVGVDIRL